MTRFGVALAGAVAAAVCGAVCSAGLLVGGVAFAALTTMDSGLDLGDTGTLALAIVSIGTLGVLFGLAMGILPILGMVALWDVAERSWGTTRAIVAMAAFVALVSVAQVLAVAAWWFDSSGAVAWRWALGVGAVAAVSAWVMLQFARRSGRGTPAEITRH